MPLKEDKDFDFKFRNSFFLFYSFFFFLVWADNGNYISNQYTGTNAMKEDITRTGCRTFKGRIDDAKAAYLRYYYNNFVDGERQNAFSFFSGDMDLIVNGDEMNAEKLVS